MNIIGLNSRLARRVAVSTLFALATIGLLGAPGVAQMRTPQKFDVPFGFTVGKTYCPPGTYTLRELSPGVLEINGAKGSPGVMFLARVESGTKTSAHTSLVFNTYGESRYLGRVRMRGETSSLQLSRSSDERAVAKAWAHRGETVVASAKP